MQKTTNKTTTATTKLPHKKNLDVFTAPCRYTQCMHTCKSVHVADPAWAVSEHLTILTDTYSHLCTQAALSISSHHAAPLGREREIKLINRSDLGLLEPKGRACVHASTIECEDYLIPV